MSLILDALRKADAERERGSVPSLHSQPVAPKSAASPRASAVRPTWLWIGVGAAIGLASAAAWFLLAGNAPPTPVARSQLAQPAQPPPIASATPVAPVAPTTSTAAPSAAVAPSDAEPIAAPAPWRQPDERKEARTEAKSGTPVPPAATGAPPAAAAPPDAPVVARDQLPPNIRSELPQFAVGGSIYSSNPAARSLIVNGQLYREKDRLTQDLSLEEIKLKSAIFSFRGHRFEVLF